MNRTRSLLDRLTSWSPILLLGGLAALTYWLDAQVTQQGARRDGSTRHDPDLFIESFRAVSFDVDGRVRQSLSAKSALHFPDDDSIDLIEPAIVLTDPGRPRFAVNADKGTVAGDRETLVFTGNVRAVRDAMPAAPPTARKGVAKAADGPSGPITVRTEFLRVLPKQERAETNRAVTIEEPRGIIQGVGMELDNKAKTLKIKSGVRGTLQPQPLTK